MGLFGSIIKKAVNEGVGNAVGKAVEKAVAPAAEKFANIAAEHFNTASDALENSTEAKQEAGTSLDNAFANLEKAAERYANNVGTAAWNQMLGEFPKWEFSQITDSTDDEGEDYFLITITAYATQNMLNQYRDILTANGYSGSDQIMRKTINGKEYCVDFTFAESGDENQIRYCIYK
ncbi:MAG: hypothetical protein MJ121_05860 [Clostridia bacterium]|nr:hypothetical protein [Clostridia bacterium]